MNIFSPLRYPGGKGRVADYFKRIFKKNSLYGGVYVEPYAGGASVALSLLFNEYASKIIINDIDQAIYSFWYSVLNKTEKLCKLIYDTPVTIETWKKQRVIQKDKDNYDLLKIGFSTFFLNRTNRSGILNAGMIGGYKQEGDWHMNARYNKQDLISRIQRIAEYGNQIELFNLDALTLVENLAPTLPDRSLFYFDPPYYVKGKDLYYNFYYNDDHSYISKKILSLEKQKWIISYDDVYQIRKLYSGYRKKTFQLNYSAGDSHRDGHEIMIFSNNLKIVNSPIVK
jgi:DNA adenine methylase